MSLDPRRRSRRPGSIAGGTDLVVESNLRGRRWPHLVSLEAIAELREFSETPERGHDRRGPATERNRDALE